jgi:SAM-dependent methyltransferase
MADQGQTNWQERSKLWTEAADMGAPGDDAVNRAIIDGAAIKSGDAVLDIASGTGDPVLSIALALAGEGRITCCDLVPRMLVTTRARAQNLGLTSTAFISADMVALPFSDGTFDGVTCRFGMMSPPDKTTAAAEAARVLKPAGRAVYVVSGAYEDNPGFWVPRRAITRFFGGEEGPTPRRHSMSAPGTLKDTLEKGGFVCVEERALTYSERIEDTDSYIRARLKRSSEKRVHGLSPARHMALFEAVLEAWKPFIADGALHIPHAVRLAIASKDAA